MKIVLAGVVILIIIGGGFFLWRNSQVKEAEVSSTAKSKFTAAMTDSQGDIEVIVIPKEITDGKPAVFQISLTTHSEDFNFDLAKISTLKTDGEILPAVLWDGGSGGHHLEGNLTFPKLAEISDKIVLEMENIGGFKRTFTWY